MRRFPLCPLVPHLCLLLSTNAPTGRRTTARANRRAAPPDAGRVTLSTSMWNKLHATPEGRLVPEATVSGDMRDPQHKQTVPGGELRAIVELIQQVPPNKPLYVGSDNQNTVGGAKHPRSEKRANADLWRR